MKKEGQVILDRSVMEFITIAVESCEFLEQTETVKHSTPVGTSLKILLLFYPKTSILPKCETIGNGILETSVARETYRIPHVNLTDLFAEKSDYLDVFVLDMKYSSQPIIRNTPEDLTGIYRGIRGFIFVSQLELNETASDSPAVCQENLVLYWGQKLVDTLRTLHSVKYSQSEDEEENQDEEDE